MNTVIVKDGSMERVPLENCHGGEGALDWKNILEKNDLVNQVLNYSVFFQNLNLRYACFLI